MKTSWHFFLELVSCFSHFFSKGAAATNCDYHNIRDLEWVFNGFSLSGDGSARFLAFIKNHPLKWVACFVVLEHLENCAAFLTN